MNKQIIIIKRFINCYALNYNDSCDYQSLYVYVVFALSDLLIVYEKIPN